MSSGYTTQDIGDCFGLHYSRIGKILRPARQTRAKAQGKTLPLRLVPHL